MMYFVPKETGFIEVPVGDYICDTRFKHIQKVKPGVKGGHLCFYGFK